MNQGLFKLIFNRRSGMLTPTWEGSAACGKAASSARACVLTLTLLFFSHSVLANPTGATVVNGTVGIAQNGNTLNITNSPNSIINWQGFSINKDEITRFIQQNGASAVLNRVIGQDPSKILGSLQSNGRVFIINPNGIVFGQGATIDVAGLVASTLKMSDADFLSGKYNFSDGNGAGAIKNQGTINSATGGQVYLIAPDIENSGIITSPKGEIVLAAGHSVSLVDPKNPEIVVSLTAPATQAVNVGQLISEGGSIGIFAGLVKQAGTINANSASIDASGRIFLKGSQSTTLTADSITTASNSVGNGGEVSISSGEVTLIAAGASIEANTSQTGNGGKVTIWSDGNTQFDGKISAQGGAQSGNGGFVETSGQHIKIGDTARVTTRAANGRSGTWLIDPSDFTIDVAANGGDISGATLSANLIETDITILSSNGANAMGSGDINVNDAVNWSANNLTLTAARDININNVLTASGSSSLTLNTATANGQDAAVSGGAVRMGFNPDGSFKGRVDFPGRSGTGFLTINGGAYTVINNLGAEGSTTTTDLQGMRGFSLGLYALGSDINASASAEFEMGAGFVPVFLGCDGACGAFNGLGHTISNLTINRPTNNVGLFSNVDGAAVSNVGLVNANVNGQSSVGSLAGYNSGTISNSYATGMVSSASRSIYVGGLVGFNPGGTINNSHAAVTVNCSDSTTFCGGLVGNSAFNGVISNSYATGDVSGGSMSLAFGGLVGKSEANSLIINSYATGKVSVGDGSSEIGGLAGNNGNSVISNSYAEGDVSGTNGSNTLGGLVGSNDNGTINGNSYATGAVNGTNTIGGLVGYNRGTISNSSSDSLVNALVGSVNIGGLVGYNAFGGTISQSSATRSISGSRFVGGFVGFNRGAISDSNASGTVIAGNNAYSISAFVGGNDYGGSISNSHSTGAVRAGDNSYDVGGLVGNNSVSYGNGGVITNSYATGNVSALDSSYNVGGLVGVNAGGSIYDSYATGTVGGGDGAHDIGGLVGFNDGTIERSYATGAVSGGANAYNLGGLAGSNNSGAYGGLISDSFATGSVIGGTMADTLGGFVGYNAGTIRTSYSIGYVSGGTVSADRGGFVGFDVGTISNSYWNTETSGQGLKEGDVGVTGLTTAEMLQSTNFIGFDFSETWAQVEGSSFPYQQSPFSQGIQVFSGTIGNYAPGAQRVETLSGGMSYGQNSIGANGFYYAFLNPASANPGSVGVEQQYQINLGNGAQHGTYYGDASTFNTGLNFDVGELVNSSTLSFANTTIDLNVRNLGTLNLGNGLTFSGSVTNAGTLNVNANTVINQFSLIGGTVSGAGNLTNGGVFNWSGGEIVELGLLTTTGVSTLSGASDKYLESTSWNNRGTVNITDGSLYLFEGNSVPVFTNQAGGTVNITSTSSTPITGESGAERFVNAGALNYNTGTSGAIDVVFENTGTVTITTGSNSTLRLTKSRANDGTINIGETSTLQLVSGYTNNGVLMGKGTIDVGQGTLINNGTIRPGASPGTLTIAGNLVLTPTSALDIELAGTMPGFFDVLNVNGNANLAGIINILQFGGYTAGNRDVFAFLNAGALNGTFAKVNSPGAFLSALGYGLNGITLTASLFAPMLPIDQSLLTTLDFSKLPNTGSGGDSSAGNFNALLEFAPSALIGGGIGSELYLGEPLSGAKRDARLLCN